MGTENIERVYINVVDDADERMKENMVEQLKKMCAKEMNRYERKYALESQIMFADFKKQFKGKKVEPYSLVGMDEMITAILGADQQNRKEIVSSEFDTYFTQLRGRHPAFEALHYKREIFHQLTLKVTEKLSPGVKLAKMNDYLKTVDKRILAEQSSSLRKALERVLMKITAVLSPQLGQSKESLFSTHASKAFGKVEKVIRNLK